MPLKKFSQTDTFPPIVHLLVFTAQVASLVDWKWFQFCSSHKLWSSLSQLQGTLPARHAPQPLERRRLACLAVSFITGKAKLLFCLAGGLRVMSLVRCLTQRVTALIPTKSLATVLNEVLLDCSYEEEEGVASCSNGRKGAGSRSSGWNRRLDLQENTCRQCKELKAHNDFKVTELWVPPLTSNLLDITATSLVVVKYRQKTLESGSKIERLHLA